MSCLVSAFYTSERSRLARLPVPRGPRMPQHRCVRPCTIRNTILPVSVRCIQAASGHTLQPVQRGLGQCHKGTSKANQWGMTMIPCDIRARLASLRSGRCMAQVQVLEVENHLDHIQQRY